MDGEQNVIQKAMQSTEAQTQEQQQEGALGIQEVTGGNGGNAGNAPDFEKTIAERDEKIASLEVQVAEAAKTAEAAEKLRGEVAEVKAQAESDRIDFKLQLAGVRNVKAARAPLSDHDNDVDKLKEAKPWLFETTGKHVKGAAPARPGFPTRGPRPTRARLSSTGAKSPGSMTTTRSRTRKGRADTCLATTSHLLATTQP